MMIIGMTAIIILLWIIVSRLTWTGPKSLKCKDNQSFFDGKCYDNTINCVIENGIWIKKREWDDYSNCIATSCNEEYELIDWTCQSLVRERVIRLNWPIFADAYSIWSYPLLRVNKEIQGWEIKMTIDFKEEYKDGRYDNFIYGWKLDWSNTNPAPFWLFFFFWKENQKLQSPYIFWYWWFFDAISNNNGGDLRNSNDLAINWVVPWNQIVGWYTWEIPISDNIVFATKKWEWSSDFKFKRLDIMNYINDNLWSNLYIWWFLSSMNNEDWWTFTNIKSIEITYIWVENSLEFVR